MTQTIRETLEEIFEAEMGPELLEKWKAGEKVFFAEEDADRPAPNVAFCDSLHRVEIIMAVEDRFGIEIPDAEANELVSLDQFEAYLKAKAQASA